MNPIGASRLLEGLTGNSSLAELNVNGLEVSITEIPTLQGSMSSNIYTNVSTDRLIHLKYEKIFFYWIIMFYYAAFNRLIYR